jgi:hypothetical protein
MPQPIASVMEPLPAPFGHTAAPADQVGLFVLAGEAADRPRNRDTLNRLVAQLGPGREIEVAFEPMVTHQVGTILAANNRSAPTVVIMTIMDGETARIAVDLSTECTVIAALPCSRDDAGIRRRFRELIGPNFEPAKLAYQLL